MKNYHKKPNKMIITIENIDSVVWNFHTENEFISFIKGIFDENEEFTEIENIPVKPNTITEGIDYINKFCGNLCITNMLLTEVPCNYN